jgi:bifunctional DNase/RNase
MKEFRVINCFETRDEGSYCVILGDVNLPTFFPMFIENMYGEIFYKYVSASMSEYETYLHNFVFASWEQLDCIVMCVEIDHFEEEGMMCANLLFKQEIDDKSKVIKVALPVSYGFMTSIDRDVPIYVTDNVLENVKCYKSSELDDYISGL